MNLFENPFVVGIVFIFVGVSGLVKKNYKGRSSILENVIKYSKKTERIISFISCVMLILGGILIIVFLGIIPALKNEPLKIRF